MGSSDPHETKIEKLLAAIESIFMGSQKLDCSHVFDNFAITVRWIEWRKRHLDRRKGRNAGNQSRLISSATRIKAPGLQDNGFTIDPLRR